MTTNQKTILPRRLAVIIPSIATISSLMFGTLAIMVLNERDFLLAGILILMASILDVLDGQLAVRLDALSEIGKELDSLADVITFGVAPTILLYHLLLVVGVLQPVAALISLVFVAAGALRLARFNTLPSNRDLYFKGLPIPAASILLILGSFWQHWVIDIWWMVVVLSTSYLMISPFPYPKSKHLIQFPRPILGGIVLSGLIFWLIGDWQAVPFGMFLMYALSGPAFAIYNHSAKEQVFSHT